MRLGSAAPLGVERILTDASHELITNPNHKLYSKKYAGHARAFVASESLSEFKEGC